jgi:hypothetical protein
MNLIWVAALVLGSGFAIFGAQRTSWALLNLAIILGCMAVGFGIGYALGLGKGNFGMVSNEGWPVAMMFGVVAAFGCVWLNSTRAQESAE